jgi:hypothetical protein
VKQLAVDHLGRIFAPMLELRLRMRSRQRLLSAHANFAPKLTGALLARHVPLFTDWPRELLERVAAAAKLNVAAYGEAIRYAGTPAESGIIIIANGFVDVESRERVPAGGKVNKWKNRLQAALQLGAVVAPRAQPPSAMTSRSSPGPSTPRTNWPAQWRA